MSPAERAAALSDAAMHRRVLELLAEAREGLQQLWVLPVPGESLNSAAAQLELIHVRIDTLLQLAEAELGGGRAEASAVSEGPRRVER